MNIKDFNPSAAADINCGIYGLPHVHEHASIILVPVEWEATVSYQGGASSGPLEILKASYQVDLCNHDFPELWQAGIWLDKFPEHLKKIAHDAKNDASKIIKAIENGEQTESKKEFEELYESVLLKCEILNKWVEQRITHWKSAGKIVGIVGGDHSTPIGYLQYLSRKGLEFGILSIDAHMDLRDAYEGFKYSHASIFYNALQLTGITKLVQVGIRDYCHDEIDIVKDNEDRIKIFFDRDIKSAQFDGVPWSKIVNQIINCLPENVYISIDIDGLDPKLCPNTGTPVPGGLEFEEAIYLLNAVLKSGKKVVGFDLCEVAGDQKSLWDGSVGARLLYQLCGVAYYSQKN